MGIQEEIRLTVQWWSKILPNPGFGSKYNQKEIGQKMKQTYIFFFISPFNSSLLRHNLNVAWFTPLECATKWLLTGWGLAAGKCGHFHIFTRRLPVHADYPCPFPPNSASSLTIVFPGEFSVLDLHMKADNKLSFVTDFFFNLACLCLWWSPMYVTHKYSILSYG